MAESSEPRKVERPELSASKAKLLELLNEREAIRKHKITPSSRNKGADTFRSPTSWSQRRLWFIDQLDGGGIAYNLPIVLRVSGPLDERALRKSFESVVARHEALRTVFVNVDGEPVQEIRSATKFNLSVIDLRGFDADGRADQVKLHAAEEAQAPFDLRIGPLLRARLLRLQDDEHVLLVTMHHIVSDGWSLQVLVRELAEFYRAHQAGENSDLQSLPLQYSDYAEWQRQPPFERMVDLQLAFWRKQLDGAEFQLDLPADRARPAVLSHRGGSVEVRLGTELSKQLKTFAREQGVTLFMALYAGWTILLARLSGQDDILVGSPVANRRNPQLEGLIGLFVNTMVLRVGVAPDLAVRDFLQRVKQVVFGALEHQDMPFERLVEALNPQRSLSWHPIFQAAFALQNVPQTELSFADLTIEEQKLENEIANFDLLLSLEERGSEISGRLTYAADLFDKATILRWIASLEVVLSAMVRAADSAIGDLPILPQEERARILGAFNETRVEYPQGVAHELFEARVEESPQSTALSYHDHQLTYAQLNGRANQLAHYLRAQGIGPDSIVGVCIERGIDMVVALLATLKAGAAYVPLDPAYPQDRLAYMLNDAAPRVLLTQATLEHIIPASTAAVVVLDREWSSIERLPTTNITASSIGLRAEHLAYLIYTSGSTGRPKGVMLSHRGLCNLATAQGRTLDVQRDSRVLQFASLSFDACTWEWLMTLSAGGCLCMASREELMPGEPLLRTLQTARVSHATLPPVALSPMPSLDGLEQLRMLVVAGEACSQALVEKWAPGRQFIDAYGPTETTVCASMHVCRPTQEGAPPIGAPIANTRIYILDRRGQPVPIGVAGEIHIGGESLARGYRNQPELTAQRFIPDAFSGERGARLYKTGDLGRWRHDGVIEYLGRNDHQVKIRGFRIELGEIEAQLLREPSVKEAAVIARQDVPGDKRLVAYVVLADEDGTASASPNAETFRTSLQARLPDYMVPSAFVLLEQMPLTPNGKLDRKVLPVPETSAFASREYQPPEGEIETVLAGIWRDLLGVDRVGRQDGFFELGGHSLLIVQMMERLRRVGLSLEIRRVFQGGTLADLARELVYQEMQPVEVPPNRIPPMCGNIEPHMLPLVELEQRHIDLIAATVPGGASNIQDIYPLAPLQEGILFHHLLDESGGDTYVLPIVIEVLSAERLENLTTALQALVDRHDILRTAVLWDDLPQPVQVVYRKASLQIERISLLAGVPIDEQIQSWVKPERQRLNINQAPFMRVQTAFDRQSGRRFVLLQLHHMTIDHVGLQIVTSEIAAHLEDRAHELPQSAPYRDHVAQSLAYAHTHASKVFFQEKLGDVNEPTAPFGLTNVHGRGVLIDEMREPVEPGLASTLRKQAGRLGVSAATLFHAAWALVVSRTTGKDDVVFGSVLLGRLHGATGAQPALGMFINTLPMRLRLRSATAKDLVEQVQAELVELLIHEQASLAEAQRCSGIKGQAPLFSSLLNFRHSISSMNVEWSRAGGVRVISGQERTNYPITVSVDDMGDGFSIKAQTDQRVSARRIIGYLRTALESLVESLQSAPQTSVLKLKVSPEQEVDTVVKRFNATRAASAQHGLIHEFFEQQVTRTPLRLATIHAGQSMTYEALNRKANQLALYLRDKGVGPDRIVGICVERSLEMVVGLLGILKAGGVYLPLDPNYPAERLGYMLADAAPRVVLIQKHLSQVLPPSSAEIVDLEDVLREIGEGTAENLPAAVSGLLPQNLVYTIYTSGSTGRPKGTGMPHRSVANLIQWHRDRWRDTSSARTLQFAALSFDVAFQEIFSTLATGGTLVLLDEWMRRDVTALVNLVREESIERMFMPPLMLQALAEHCDAHDIQLLGLKDVIVAGEQLRITPELVRFFATCGDCRLHNHYGPTETHVVTSHTLESDPKTWPLLPSIGRPLSNTQIYILDRHLRPVPMEVEGEIYIAGENVARGYLHRPDFTASRFLSDPFARDPHARMYKTGDLGRWRNDGTIEYLGRNDDQVKIRGYRIELGEIETALLQHLLVKEAVVVARNDSRGEKRLVAYVTTQTEHPSVVEELRGHLRDLLPQYMVPSAFVVLDHLPVTPTGKLNRRALPEPDLATIVSNQYEAPRGEIERVLVDIWKGILGIETIGRNDHFFELGGHSLLAMKSILTINQRLGCALKITDLYGSPTARELSARIRGVDAQDELVDLSKEAMLDATIKPCAGTLVARPKVILLTGATGFVGRFLLWQLLHDTEATVYCTTRAASQQQANERLISALKQWELWRPEFSGRVVPIAGDLRLPRLGSSEAVYQHLCQNVDTVYHCATSMNHLETYAMAKAANVDSARELLTFASTARPKLINFISTFGVFNAPFADEPRVVDETTTIDQEEHWSSRGYAASKWVGEKIFLLGHERGIACNVFRLGLVWADAQRGRFDERQNVHRIIKSCLLSGCAIAGYRFPMPPTPVDYVVRGTVWLATKHNEGGGVFHLAAPNQLVDGVFERCNELLGTSLRLVSYYDWIQELKRLHHAGRSLPAVPIVESMFSIDEATFQKQQRSRRSVLNIQFDSTRTETELREAGIFVPVLNDHLLQVCLEDMLSRDPDISELRLAAGVQRRDMVSLT